MQCYSLALVSMVTTFVYTKKGRLFCPKCPVFTQAKTRQAFSEAVKFARGPGNEYCTMRSKSKRSAKLFRNIYNLVACCYLLCSILPSLFITLCLELSKCLVEMSKLGV